MLSIYTCETIYSKPNKIEKRIPHDHQLGESKPSNWITLGALPNPARFHPGRPQPGGCFWVMMCQAGH